VALQYGVAARGGPGGHGGERARGVIAAFRGVVRCLGEYRTTLSEVCDAVLCKQDRVRMAAELISVGVQGDVDQVCLVPVPRRDR
jgi:hypothetical protein